MSAHTPALAAAQLLRPSDSRWKERCQEAEIDFAQTAAYHRFAEESGEGEAFLLVYGGAEKYVAWPFLLREVNRVEGLENCPYRDATSVYGYPGPLAHGVAPGDPMVEEAWDSFVEVWRKQSVIGVFTRFHPILRNHELVPAHPGSASGVTGGVCLAGQTVSIDLTASREAAWRFYSHQFRNQIARARRLGIATTFDHDWEHLGEFEEIYAETMARNGASEYYRFSTSYLRGLRHALGGHGSIALARLENRAVSAIIVTEYGGIVSSHLGGTRTRDLPFSPFKLIVDDLCIWGKQRGNHSMHLGGGRGGKQDDLFRFKCGFSPRRHDFYLGSWILDQDAYADVLQRRRTFAAGRGLQLADPDYFPAYRAPLTPGAAKDWAEA